MGTAFDPYHKWLGIPPDRQPPDHYTLLGVPVFENDPDVIDSAADQRMSHLRKFQTGQHSDLSQKLLNEVANARICLLNAAKKAEYDRKLHEEYDRQFRERDKLGAKPALEARPWAKIETEGDGSEYLIKPSPTSSQPSAPEVSVPARGPITLADALMDKLGWSPGVPGEAPSPVTAASVESDFTFLNDAIGQPKPRAARPDETSHEKSKPDKKFAVPYVVVLSAGAAVLALCVLLLCWPTPKTQVIIDWPPVEREGAKATIDGMPVTVPASGQFKVVCEPGQHDFVASRNGFQDSQQFHVARGQTVTISVKLTTVKTEAEVIVDWPPAEREGAKVTIDGRPVTVPASGQFKVVCEPGQHDFVATGNKFKPYRQSFHVARGQALTIHVRRVPVDRPVRPSESSSMVFDWPSSHREGVKVSVDGKRVDDFPETGALKVACTAGTHTVRAEWPASLLEWEIPVRTREKVEVPAPLLLKFLWPVGERSEAKLLIDGKTYRVPNGDPDGFIIALKSDSESEFVRIDVTRSGYRPQPNRMVVQLVKGGIEPISVKFAPVGVTNNSREGDEGDGVWSVNILPLVKPERDTVKGSWVKDGATVATTTAQSFARIMLPVLPVKVEGDYDLLVAFTRHDGNTGVCVILPVGSRSCELVLGGWGGRINALETIDGKAGNQTSTASNANALTNEQPYELLVKVRLEGEDASIEAFLDKTRVIQWKGAVASLGLHQAWELPQPQRLALGADANRVTFRSVQLLSGGSGAKSEEPGPGNEAKAEEPPKTRLPVPDPAAQQKVLAIIRETYKEEYKNKGTLARKLWQKAREAQDPVERFVLLQEAGDLSPDMAFGVVIMLARDYNINLLEAKAQAIEKRADLIEKSLNKGPKSKNQIVAERQWVANQQMTLARVAVTVIDEAVSEDNFDVAKQLGRQASQLARSSKNKELIQTIAAKNRAVLAAAQAYADAEQAAATLKENPNDPDANLALGRYKCFSKRDWKTGLPMLALGSDDVLKALAKRDIAGAASAKEQVKLGDAWWDAGGNRRAVYWYRQALPELTGLERDRVEKRSAGYPVSARGAAKAPSPEYLTPERRKANLLVDGSFEGRPLQNWSIRSWRGNTKAVQIDSNEAKVGRQSAVLRLTEPDDVMFTQVVAVKPKTRYLFSGWAKTQDIVVEKGGGNRGAALSLWGGFESSRSLSASNDWTYLELVFDSGERTSVEVGARLGHHGSITTGTAWFDDLCLIEISESSKGSDFRGDHGSREVVEKYVYGSGYFTRYSRERGSEWVESKTDGSSTTYRFVETSRDKNWIHLFDAGRNMLLRLPVGGGACAYSMDGGRTWNRLYDVVGPK